MNTKHWTLLAVSAGLALTGCGTQGTVEAAKGEPGERSGFALPWSKPKTATIPAGTSIKVRTMQALSSNSVSAGDAFAATLASPIVIDGQTIVPAGATARGIVANADKGGRVKGVASIVLRLTELQAPEDQVTIQTSAVAKNARTTRGQDTAKVGIGAGIGAAIGAIAGGGKGAAIGAASGGAAGTGVVLATRGEPAVIGAESLLSFQLTAPVTVELD